MGRNSTGAVTTGEVKRLELSFLLRQGYLKKNSFSLGGLSWTDGSTMQIDSSLEGGYVKLTYFLKADGEHEPIKKDQMIYLSFVPSNLGRGEVPYFICPSTGRKARVLYMCYGSPIFKSRTAYHYRIYYPSQQASKLYYHNTRYWDLDNAIKKLKARQKKQEYQGKPTKLVSRIWDLEEKRAYHDRARFVFLPKSIQKHFPSLAQ